MGAFDIPPEHAPTWLLPATTFLLAVSAVCWDVVYVLLTRDAIRTHIYGMPVVPLALNVSWELVYCLINAADGAVLEAAGLFVWLLLDLSLVWATVAFAQSTWSIGRSAQRARAGGHLRYRQLVSANMAAVLAVLVLAGITAHTAVAKWWLSRPGRGFGDKTGKFWRDREGYDTTELAFWTAAVSQTVLSAWCLAMLRARSVATASSRAVWAFRMLGSVVGLGLANGLLWWYWPEAHGYWVHPVAVILNATSLFCDIAYGRLLCHVLPYTAGAGNGAAKSGAPRAHPMMDGRAKKGT